MQSVKDALELIKEEHETFELEDIRQYLKHIHIQAAKSGLLLAD